MVQIRHKIAILRCPLGIEDVSYQQFPGYGFCTALQCTALQCIPPSNASPPQKDMYEAWQKAFLWHIKSRCQLLIILDAKICVFNN